MQRGSCQTTELLISKYADGEASADERAHVDAHVAGCDPCAHKLTSYIEMAAIFADLPPRPPESHLRQNLFSEINRLKVQEREAEAAQAPLLSPTPPRPQSVTPRRTFLQRFLAAASPFAAAGTAVFVLLAVLTLVAPEENSPISVPYDLGSDQSILIPTGVPTLSGSRAISSRPPGPVKTAGASAPRT